MPLAIELAKRTDFLDHPVGYKRHFRATPYLGGAALTIGFISATWILGAATSELVPILLAAAALAVLGALDDRFNVNYRIRVFVVCLVGAGLYWAGVGWEFLPGAATNFIFSILFVLGVVNAFNLMDNLDGASGAVGLVATATVAGLAVIEGSPELAALCIAMTGACAGFLPYNLSSPARIFLGDGGSMPLGVTVAAGMMALSGGAQLGWAMVLVAAVLVGLPALDTALVIVSRRRRGAMVLSGSRDHLTHRLLLSLGTPRRVAVVLACGQAALGAVGVGLYQGSQPTALLGGAACVAVGMAAIALLETPRWAPALQKDALYEGLPEDSSLPLGSGGPAPQRSTAPPSPAPAPSWLSASARRTEGTDETRSRI